VSVKVGPLYTVYVTMSFENIFFLTKTEKGKPLMSIINCNFNPINCYSLTKHLRTLTVKKPTVLGTPTGPRTTMPRATVPRTTMPRMDRA
jgi:hypothetical protein